MNHPALASNARSSAKRTSVLWSRTTAANLGLGVALTVSPCACGLLGADGNPPAAKLDPLSGFVDKSAVQVCMDGRLVVSSSSAPNGPLSLCVPDGLQTRSCANQADCNNAERCSCARCVTPACRTGTDCEQGQICQNNRCTAACDTQTKCPGNQRCIAGGCSVPCTVDTDCAYGEVCSSFDRVCVVKLCGQSVGCPSGQQCVEQQTVADIRQPHVIADASNEPRQPSIAYVELATATSCSIYRALVQSDQRWDVSPITPVLAPDASDHGCVGAPSVLVHDNAYVMFAARGDGTAIVRARSSDGITFERDAEPVLTPQLAWEKGWVGAPGVSFWNGSTVLVYQAGPDSGLGIARVDDHLATRVSDGPWLTASDVVDGIYWREVRHLSSPFAFEHDGALVVYLTVRGVEGIDARTSAGEIYPADVNDSIGLASTRDLHTHTMFPLGAVFARKTNMRAYLGEAEPTTLYSPDGSTMYYVRGDASGTLRSGLGIAKTVR